MMMESSFAKESQAIIEQLHKSFDEVKLQIVRAIETTCDNLLLSLVKTTDNLKCCNCHKSLSESPESRPQTSDNDEPINLSLARNSNSDSGINEAQSCTNSSDGSSSCDNCSALSTNPSDQPDANLDVNQPVTKTSLNETENQSQNVESTAEAPTLPNDNLIQATTKSDLNNSITAPTTNCNSKTYNDELLLQIKNEPFSDEEDEDEEITQKSREIESDFVSNNAHEPKRQIDKLSSIDSTNIENQKADFSTIDSEEQLLSEESEYEPSSYFPKDAPLDEEETLVSTKNLEEKAQIDSQLSDISSESSTEPTIQPNDGINENLVSFKSNSTHSTSIPQKDDCVHESKKRERSPDSSQENKSKISRISSDRIPTQEKYKILHLDCFMADCSRKCSLIHELNEHLYRRHNILQFRCPHEHCLASFSTQNRLNRHLDTAHRDVKKWKCCDCSKECSSAHLLSCHISLVHERGRFVCITVKGCTFTGQSRSEVLKHSWRIHGSESPDRTTSNMQKEEGEIDNSDDQLHKASSEISNVSSKYIVKHLTCILDRCGKTVADIDDLHEHLLRRHGALPFICSIEKCSDSFKRRDELYSHLKCRHSSVNRIECDKCGKMAKSLVGLYTHIHRRHHYGDFVCSYRACLFEHHNRGAVIQHYTETHE